MRQVIVQTDRSQFLLAPGFAFALFLLLINDLILKEAFGNIVTGKLSDFAGLFVFPFFLSAFFPTVRNFMYPATGILFCAWKSPLSNFLIDFVNGFELVTIGRTVDYTDLVALVVLPASLFYFNIVADRGKEFTTRFARVAASSVAIISVFAFGATTMADERHIGFDRKYHVALRISDIRSVLQRNTLIRDLKFEREVDVFPKDKYPDVETDPDTWFGEFNLDQRTCSSTLTNFHFIVEETPDGSRISPSTVNFRCPDEKMKPTVNSAVKRYEEELQESFEREVIRPLIAEGNK